MHEKRQNGHKKFRPFKDQISIH